MGRTAQSVGAKQPGSRTQHFWDCESVCGYLEQSGRADAADLVRELADWAARQESIRIRFGRGANPTVGFAVREDGRDRTVLYFGPNERGELTGYISFGFLIRTTAFESEEARRELQRRVVEIDPEIDRDNIERFPSFSAEHLLEDDKRKRFESVLTWVAEQVAADEHAPSG